MEVPVLVTQSRHHNLYKQFSKPPSRWVVFGDSVEVSGEHTTPDTWPSPLFTSHFSGVDNIDIYYVYPFSDSSVCIHFTCNSIDMLIIPELLCLPDSIGESIFREKYDIVILPNPGNLPVVKIHKLLRPQFTLVLQSQKEGASIITVENIIQPTSHHFTFAIAKDKKNKVYIEKQE